MFRNLGQRNAKTLWFSHEKELDKVTAISGSGPAYYFLFIDLLEKISTELGFNKKIAKKLVYQTALGSIQLLMSNSKSAEQLTKNIAIKGGTTEAAIKVFKKNNQLKKIINQAVNAAYIRSVQLGKK